MSRIAALGEPEIKYAFERFSRLVNIQLFLQILHLSTSSSCYLSQVLLLLNLICRALLSSRRTSVKDLE